MIPAQFIEHGQEFRFKRGEHLWEQGKPASSLLFLVSGAAKIIREWPTGRHAVVDLVFRGDILGEASIREDGVYLGTCIALSSGRGIRIPSATVRTLARTDPTLMNLLLETALRHQESYARRLDEIALGSVTNRLARVIIRLGDEVGLPDARGTFVPVRLSRSDLADMVGCRVETTIRTMTRWERQGVVETLREGLVIMTPQALAEAAHATT